MAARPVHLLVFREGTRPASGSALTRALAQQLHSLQNSFESEEILRALLRAGELECAVADAFGGSAELQEITDVLAAALVRSQSISDPAILINLLASASVPESLTVSVPEGFAYYALHPLAYSDVVERLPELPARVVVVGIRSIGSTLSAATAAGLQHKGVPANRFTVRPGGHPYNRRTQFSAEQMKLVQTEISHGASFLIVDEGPGLSGSSFLSVAEALLQAGVPREKITLICSHDPQPDRMCAENAAARWQQFRCITTSKEARRPADAHIWIGGGEWRKFFLPDESAWPACWPSFERLKYLSGKGDGNRFYKFLGLGHYGDQIFGRERCVAAEGFAPAPSIEDHGFISYPFLNARPMRSEDLTRQTLELLATYCAFRLRTFAIPSANLSALQEMAEHNLHEFNLDLPVALRLESAVIADGRMQPHEWLLSGEVKMLKTDCGSHGDDHFFPGPTDIAWDLAGAIVEWRMSAPQAEAFLEIYRRASGDDAQNRIADYVNAYAVFRLAYCTMAANAMEGTQEQRKLEQSAELYRTRLQSNVVGRLAFVG
jgi:hypothetical protein